MQQVDDPPSLQVGTEVSAKYKGAFCEAKVSKVVRNIKVKVAYKQGLGSGIVSDDAIKAAPGQLRVGAVVEVRHPERKEFVEATVTKIQDCSQYTVVFDDGDITTLRRTALCLKSGRHFNESETLDQLPLTHPEHFGNPVVGGRRGRRRGHTNDDSSEEEDEADVKEVVNEKEENIGKIVCVEIESKKKDKEKWFPGLVVAPTAQATVRIRVKDEYLVRSFKDGRYYTVPKKEATEFTREAAGKQDGPAVQAALEYLDSDVLPPHWDRDALFGLSNSSSEEEGEIDSDSSDDEPREEKDRFVAQLYKYMDDRGTPLNKVPSIQNRDVDLYRLFRAVQKRGGYNRVTAQNQWKPIAMRLGFTPITVSVANLVKQAYKKFLQPYGEFHRKLGCSMLMTPRNSNRSKGRSLVRANSVASPKPIIESNKDAAVTMTKAVPSPLASVSSTSSASMAVQQSTTAATASSTSASISATSVASVATTLQSITDESENTSESSTETTKNKRKISISSSSNNNKVKGLIEKYEEKSAAAKDDGDVPLSKIKAVVTSARAEEKEKEKEKEKDKDKDKEKDKEKEREREISKETVANQSSSSAQTTREASPTGSNTSSKKEKFQKKPTLQPNEEKRSKRRKEESMVEKVDIGDAVVEVGDKLKVYYHEKKVTYEAKVIEIAIQRGTPMYLVHYTGWNNRYDEWVPRERIAENITKGPKQKGRPPGTEKSRENPPKPPSSMSMSMIGSSNISPTVSGISTATRTPTTTSKRGRGRSDSMPPRSTTPSSVASNSSRTKSPATSSFKKRPTRMQPNTLRRTSANISDVSVPTDSDTDSDEPVRRPTRAAKEAPFKSVISGGATTGKTPTKAGKLSVSAANSQSDTDDDDEILRVAGSSGGTGASGGAGAKGRDYDLNQIRSELKGFQGLKSPTQAMSKDTSAQDTKIGLAATIKTEIDVEYKPSVTTATIVPKKETKTEHKEEPIKSSSTDVSSETDSFGDDDSQSSDKTTTLENMTKKFQQKINAGKQRAMEKQPTGKTRIVEKIIKDSLAEKRQESLKAKPSVKEESKALKMEIETKHTDAARKSSNVDVKDEVKKTQLSPESKPSVMVASRFGSLAATSKYTSVIVEKPPGTGKKSETTAAVKRVDALKKSVEAAAQMQTKKFVEPAHKEIMKVESPAAGSPSSTTSSSSSTGSLSSASTSNTRSLPDMSKLDISGSSSSIASAYTGSSSKEAKYSPNISKPISPDIYEFKDPEPFEFEVRKSPMVTNSGGSHPVSVMPPSTTSRKQAQKTAAASTGFHPASGDQQSPTATTSAVTNPLATLPNRKKRGSPMKDAAAEKVKQARAEEKLSPLVADAKLLHPTAVITTATAALATPMVKSSQAVQSKVITPNPAATSTHGKLAPPPPPSILTPTAAILHNLPAKTEVAPAATFDVLRKSPSFNLNINALNEELAQTVQETTRALTDALQTPTTPPVVSIETTPIKVEPSITPSVTKTKSPANQPIIGNTKLTTPPNAAATTKAITVGSPFVETRRDFSNVFELSTGEGGSSNSESKDNKFELENVEILLSASVGGFDLDPAKDPAKYGSKPTSIADKVLKAISQKKEEVESKIKEKDDDPTSTQLKLTSPLPATFPKLAHDEVYSLATGLHAVEPLTINTELPTTSYNVGALSHEKKDGTAAVVGFPVAPSNLAKHTPLTSPDSKLGILESITVKNNDLSETIQKLECAIQRKTPVGGQQVSAILSGTGNFSDDSGDTTDSERRLVIEDVNEEATESQKHVEHKIGLPVKLDAGKGGTTEQSAAIPAPIPLKVIATPQRLQSMINSNIAVPQIAMSKLPGANSAMTTTTYLQQQQQQIATVATPAAASLKLTPTQSTAGTTISQLILSGGNAAELKPIDSSTPIQLQQGTTVSIAKTAQSQLKLQPNQRGSTVVPIVVPDIPVSVVVASSAVPSVVAAAQAAAAAYQNPKASGVAAQKHSQQQPQQPQSIMSGQTLLHQQTTGKFLPTNLNQALLQPSPSSSTLGVATSGVNKHILNVKTLPTAGAAYNLPASTSGFFLNPLTELRPDDGVKPIPDEPLISSESRLNEETAHTSSSNAATTAAATAAALDTHNDAINLLCEETIPGSPAPAFGGKEESPFLHVTTQAAVGVEAQQQQQHHQQSQQIASTHHTLNEDKIDIRLPTSSGVVSGNVPMMPAIAAIIMNPTTNSSPNDSQDESSEELKKHMDIENEEVIPRKRRRTRKQSEMMATSSEHQHLKRRRAMTCSKKNNVGSESDENSDTISQRSTTSARQHQQLHQQQQQQMHQQQTTTGLRPCPYNFLVQLDSSLNPDQCISILLKQIQDLRKTYNMIKGDLASIDRRRKKLRRREREKKQQQLQSQQQIKISS